MFDRTTATALLSALFLAIACSGNDASTETESENDSASPSPTSHSGGGAGEGSAAGGNTGAGGGVPTGGASTGGKASSTTDPVFEDPADLFFEGVRYPLVSGGETEFLRFRSALYAGGHGYPSERAGVTPGVGLVFETDSPSISIHFRYRQGDEHRYGGFGVFQNDVLADTVYAPDSESTTTLNVASIHPGETVRYRVVLPPWSNPILTSIDLEPGYALQTFAPIDRPAYVALGDSITHGSGQNESFEGYAWQTAEALGFELFNLAVGGSGISVPIAESLEDWEEIELITVLVGFNDWFWNGKSAMQFASDYEALLDAIRLNHPETPIFCLQILETSRTGPASPDELQELRDALESLVASRIASGDAHLYLAPATAWLSLDEDFADGTHLNPSGGGKLAAALTAHIQTELGR